MKKVPPDKPILLKIPDQNYTYSTHAVDNFPQCQPQICHLDTLDTSPSTLTKINDFHHIKTEPTIETSKSKGLWFVPVKLHDPEDVATQAMIDTGCTLTCIRDTAWADINKNSHATYDMEFTKSTGTVIGATAQMKTKIAGHAIIRLIFPTDTGSHYSLYTRAMIVEDLQGPIYLGQDIFQATHIFHSLTPTHMIMSIGRHTYRTPYIRSRRDRPIARLQPSSDNDNEHPSVAINHTEENCANEIIFTTTCPQTIPPDSRTKITISFPMKNHNQLQLPCIVELRPILTRTFQCPKVVPTLNQLSETGQTEIMVVNNQSTSVTMPAGTPVATANEQDIISINQPNSELEQIQFSHCEQTEEVSTIEATSDSKEHKNKLLSDSAILNTDPIPERHDITKRAPTISDKELLEKFHIDHLEQSVRNKVKKLILQFRPIWSEHPFDLGLHRYIKHNIVLTGDLPPCPKQRFWPANRREAAEQLIDNLQKFDIVSKTVTDWATNIVLIKKQAERRKQWSRHYSMTS